jgi:hypothetical protein
MTDTELKVTVLKLLNDTLGLKTLDDIWSMARDSETV